MPEQQPDITMEDFLRARLAVEIEQRTALAEVVAQQRILLDRCDRVINELRSLVPAEEDTP